MSQVNAIQIRAARALLNWTQLDLATAANVGLATLKRFESSARLPIPAVKTAIIRALEEEGISFENDGKKTGVSVAVRKRRRPGRNLKDRTSEQATIKQKPTPKHELVD